MRVHAIGIGIEPSAFHVVVATLIILALSSCAAVHPGQSVQHMSSAEALKRAAEGRLRFLDVRSADERLAGSVPGATVVLFGPANPEMWIFRRASRADVERFLTSVRLALPDKNMPIATFCNVGSRSAGAAEALANDGYANVSTIIDGYLGNHLGPGIEKH